MTLTQRVLFLVLLPVVIGALRLVVHLAEIYWFRKFLLFIGARRFLRWFLQRVAVAPRVWADPLLSELSFALPTWGQLRYLSGFLQTNLGQHQAAVRNLRAAIRFGYRRADAFFYLGYALASLGHHRRAENAYAECIRLAPTWAQALVNLAHTKLHLGREDQAIGLLRRAITIDPRFAMPHQNLAAQYDRYSYNPQPLDLEGRPEVLLYDGYNLVGERAIHLGEGAKGVDFFGKALIIQRRLAQEICLPATLRRALEDRGLIDPSLPIRLLPYEWTTQIGHIALLDTYRKTQLLGWRPMANNLVLAPPGKVANRAYLQYWRSHFKIVEEPWLVEALFPYQRVIGDCFNAFLLDDGTAVCWMDMGARAHIEWDRQNRLPLLKLEPALVARGRETLRALGMPGDAWFATLHIREGGYHREFHHSIQSHRNASAMDYLPAIRRVVERGGWVVRMGDRTMTPLPSMRGVIDYAHSGAKSDWMDVFLCGGARFFIGTTSGLTNAVISFGTPCVLVNCVSNYSQLWNRRVLFALKAFWSKRERRYLNVRKFTAPPLRWRIFNMRRLAEDGIMPVDNEPTDIVDVVDEMLDLLDARSSDAVPESRGVVAFRAAMGDKTIWGNGRPSARFFDRNFDRFFGD